MAVTCGIVDHVLEEQYYPKGAPWLVGDNQSNDNPRINGLITAIFALITYVPFYPVALLLIIFRCQQLSKYHPYLVIHLH